MPVLIDGLIKKMRVSILGCGRWGSYIAWYINHIGNDTLVWGMKGDPLINRLMSERKNDMLSFDDSVRITDDLDEAMEYGEMFIISISSQHLRSFCGDLKKYDFGDRPLILCMKGIEETTGKRLTEIINECLTVKNLAVWVGPGHPQDYLAGIPNCMVIDSQSRELKERLTRQLSSELIRFYIGEDLIGNEVGAASKNVIGIAAGMLDGLKLSSLKGALMSRGTREISRLIEKMGGNELSAYGLCHLGDYEATVFSQHSHNRKYGESFVTGEKYSLLAEGVATSKAMHLLGEKYSVDLPICNAVYEILYLDKDPKHALNEMFKRSLTSEFYK